jgi:hypothetical protein
MISICREYGRTKLRSRQSDRYDAALRRLSALAMSETVASAARRNVLPTAVAVRLR